MYMTNGVDISYPLCAISKLVNMVELLATWVEWYSTGVMGPSLPAIELY